MEKHGLWYQEDLGFICFEIQPLAAFPLSASFPALHSFSQKTKESKRMQFTASQEPCGDCVHGIQTLTL